MIRAQSPNDVIEAQIERSEAEIFRLLGVAPNLVPFMQHVLAACRWRKLQKLANGVNDNGDGFVATEYFQGMDDVVNYLESLTMNTEGEH